MNFVSALFILVNKEKHTASEDFWRSHAVRGWERMPERKEHIGVRWASHSGRKICSIILGCSICRVWVPGFTEVHEVPPSISILPISSPWSLFLVLWIEYSCKLTLQNYQTPPPDPIQNFFSKRGKCGWGYKDIKEKILHCVEGRS